jgi:glycosyltransferase involved in cell wall biosynthesis
VDEAAEGGGRPAQPRPRVVLVAQAAPAQGGIPTFVETVMNDPVLASRFELTLLNTTRRAVREAGTWAPGNALHAAIDAIRVFRAARRTDVVHVQTALLPTPPLLRAVALCGAARLAGATVLCHAHTGLINSGPTETFRPSVLQRVLLRRLRFADMLTVSDAGARGLRPLLPAVETVDNPVEVAAFEPADPGTSPPTILFVGTLAERKGLFDLLAAMRQLRDEGINDWRLEVVGAGNEAGDREAARVRAAYRAAGLDEALVGPLWGADLRARLRAASVFCLPSHTEGQPIGILEAMASGLPVVATRVGAIPDQVRDGLDGILVDPGDAAGLGAALRRLVTSPELRTAMGASARARAEERFDLSWFRARMGEIYERGADEARTRRRALA